jgi:hypothetical protein
MSHDKAEQCSYLHLGWSALRVATVSLTLLLAFFWTSSGLAQPEATDDLEARLGLADLTAYRSALAGKTTADGARASDAPRPVSFRNLWDHPEIWSGQRVQVEGRVVRAFRQGAVGSFPPLQEAWLSTTTGDLFCVAFPWDESPGRKDETFATGQLVSFTGTFLKTIGYSASDQARLAPLIVGDKPPTAAEKISSSEPEASATLRALGASPMTGQNADRSVDAWSPAARGLVFVLGLAGVLVLAWRHLNGRVPSRRTAPIKALADPPLEFVDMEPVNGAVHPNARSD